MRATENTPRPAELYYTERSHICERARLYAGKTEILSVIRVPYMLNRPRFKRHKCMEHRKDSHTPEFIRRRKAHPQRIRVNICLSSIGKGEGEGLQPSRDHYYIPRT